MNDWLISLFIGSVFWKEWITSHTYAIIRTHEICMVWLRAVFNQVFMCIYANYYVNRKPTFFVCHIWLVGLDDCWWHRLVVTIADQNDSDVKFIEY